MKRRLGDVEASVGVEHDAAGITELAGHDADPAGRRDPKDLSNLVAGTDEDAAVGAGREIGAMVVTCGESNDETELAIGSEAKYLSDGTQEHEVVARRRGHADESPHRLAVRARGFLSGKDRDEQIGPPRKRPILGGIDAEDQRAPISFVDEP